MNYFNYFSEIEELFIRRRGRNLLLSPLDWALIETWQERAVPLHVILSAIEKVFDGVDKQPPGAQKRPIKSLMYCREEIETQHAAWLERQIGKNGDGASAEKSAEEKSLFSDEAIAVHLREVSTALEKTRAAATGDWRDVLTKILNELSKLEKDFQANENIEQTLENLDASVDDALLREFADDKIKAEIKKQLAGYRGKMETEIYERTFNLMLLKRLREQENVPRLGLFYL